MTFPTRAIPIDPPIIPIDWSDYAPRHWPSLPTSELVRYVARAEILIDNDPVRARSAGMAPFRRGLAECYAELDARLPREE